MPTLVPPRRRVRYIAVLVVGLTLAAQGALVAADAHAAPLDAVTIGYSNSPGWLPLAVAQQAGIFREDGLDVRLIHYGDYVASIDAMSRGRIDANTQTLNDTLAGSADGAPQLAIAVTDHSAGNDAVVCDQSITTIADMRGRTVAAEAGLPDHFLLLQGLAKAGLTEDDVSFRDVLTADAAASFADGQFDCVAVPTPSIAEAMKRPGASVLFTSWDFPGAVPNVIAASHEMVTERPGVAQKLVDAWYDTLAYINAHPERSRRIMARTAKLSSEHYRQLARGTRILPLDDALASFQPGSSPSSLFSMGAQIDSFLVTSGLTKHQVPLSQVLAGQFTQEYATHLASSSSSSSSASRPAA